jgi:hypothetical protein
MATQLGKRQKTKVNRKRGPYGVVVGKPERNRKLGRLGKLDTHGRII